MSIRKAGEENEAAQFTSDQKVCSILGSNCGTHEYGELGWPSLRRPSLRRGARNPTAGAGNRHTKMKIMNMP